MIFRTGVLAGVLAVFSAAGNSQEIRLPVLGVFAEGGRMVSVRGVPGALTFSIPAAAPAGFRLLTMTGDGSVALGLLDSGKMALFRPGSQALRVLEGVEEGVRSVVLSPKASAAALCKPAEGRVQVVNLAAESVNPSLLSACPDAVSDDGLSIWVRSARAGEATLLQAGADPRYESFGTAVTALAFLPGSRDALAAAGGDLWLVGGGPRERLASGVGNPIFLSAALSGNRILLLSRDGSFEVRSRSGERLTSGSCDCEPASTGPTAVADIFWLARQPGRPALLLDLRDRKPATWLIPAAEVEVRP